MIRRNTIVLFVIFLILLGAVLYINQDSGLQVALKMATATPTETLKLIGGYPVNTVQEIAYSDNQGNTYDIQTKGDGKWATDKGYAVNTASALEILQFLSDMRSLGKLDSGSPLDKAGLDPFQYKIELTDPQGSMSTLLIGAQTATKTAYYVKWNSNLIEMVSSGSIEPVLSSFAPESLLAPIPTALSESK